MNTNSHTCGFIFLVHLPLAVLILSDRFAAAQVVASYDRDPGSFSGYLWDLWWRNWPNAWCSLCTTVFFHYSSFLSFCMPSGTSKTDLYKDAVSRDSVSPYSLQQLSYYTYLVVVIPEYIGWRLGAVLNCAREVNGTALVHVQVRTSQDRSCRYCNNTSRWKSDRRIICKGNWRNGCNNMNENKRVDARTHTHIHTHTHTNTNTSWHK